MGGPREAPPERHERPGDAGGTIDIAPGMTRVTGPGTTAVTAPGMTALVPGMVPVTFPGKTALTAQETIPTTTRSRLRRALSRAVLPAILVVALGVRLWDLGRYGLWTDEAYTLNVARQGLWDVVRHEDQTPPLFALVLHGWTNLFGTSAFAVRMLPALLGTACVALVWPIARRFGPPWLATVLVACSVYLVIISQEARAFSLLAPLSALAFLALLRWLEAPTKLRLAVYTVVMVAALYTHVWAVFLALAHCTAVALHSGPRRLASLPWLASTGSQVLAWLPWMPVLLGSMRRVTDGFWIEAPGWDDLYWALFVLSGGGALVAACLGLAQPHARRSGPPLRLIAAWVLVPVAVPFALSFAVPVFTPRYVAFLGVPAAVLAAALAARSRWPRATAAAVLAASAVVLVGFLSSAGALDSRQDWPAMRELVEAGPVEAVVLFNKGYCDSATDQDLACAYSLAAPDTLRLVPMPFEDRGVTPPVADALPTLPGAVQGAPTVWVAYSYPNDTERLIPAGLEGLGYANAGEWHLKRIELLRFDKPADVPQAPS